MNLEGDVNRKNTRTVRCFDCDVQATKARYVGLGFTLTGSLWRSADKQCLMHWQRATAPERGGVNSEPQTATPADIPGESATRPGGDGDVSALVGINE